MTQAIQRVQSEPGRHTVNSCSHHYCAAEMLLLENASPNALLHWKLFQCKSFQWTGKHARLRRIWKLFEKLLLFPRACHNFLFKTIYMPWNHWHLAFKFSRVCCVLSITTACVIHGGCRDFQRIPAENPVCEWLLPNESAGSCDRPHFSTKTLWSVSCKNFQIETINKLRTAENLAQNAGWNMQVWNIVRAVGRLPSSERLR